jgi:hypothetical protein
MCSLSWCSGWELVISCDQIISTLDFRGWRFNIKTLPTTISAVSLTSLPFSLNSQVSAFLIPSFLLQPIVK